MNSSVCRQKVLILDCCYSGAFPGGWAAKGDSEVHTLEKFHGGRGKVVLTASDSTQYSFEGGDLSGTGSASLFTRYLVEGLRSGAADQDEDGDVGLDELYTYVHDRVTEVMPQQRPKKQEDLEGRIVIARNCNWQIPAYVRMGLESPLAADRLNALNSLSRLYRIGNSAVRATVTAELIKLANDDSRRVSQEAANLLGINRSEPDAEDRTRRDAEERTRRDAEERTRRDAEERTRRDAEERTRRDAEERSSS